MAKKNETILKDMNNKVEFFEEVMGFFQKVTPQVSRRETTLRISQKSNGQALGVEEETKSDGQIKEVKIKFQRVNGRCEARRTVRSVFASPSTVAADQRCCRDVAELGRQSQVFVGSYEVPFCRDRRLGTQLPKRIVPRRSQCAPRLAKNLNQPFQQGSGPGRFPAPAGS